MKMMVTIEFEVHIPEDVETDYLNAWHKVTEMEDIASDNGYLKAQVELAEVLQGYAELRAKNLTEEDEPIVTWEKLEDEE